MSDDLPERLGAAIGLIEFFADEAEMALELGREHYRDVLETIAKTARKRARELMYFNTPIHEPQE